MSRGSAVSFRGGMFLAVAIMTHAAALPAAEFPKPYPEKQFTDFGIKILQPDGSAYRVPREDWEGARRRVAADSGWTEWAAQQQAGADAWMKRNRDRAGWEAGWSHEFISPVDSARLVWTEDVPGEDVGHIMSASGGKVAVSARDTPTIFRAWVGEFRKRHSLMAVNIASVYRLTGDKRYAEWVCAQLDFYADNYDSWGKGVAQRKNSHLGFQSLNDAMIVSRLVEATRLVFDYAEPARRQAWFDKLFLPEAELLARSGKAIHNIATWHRAAQAQIALLYRDDTLFEKAMGGQFGLREQIRRGVTSDYYWFEQSMGYNDFIVTATVPLFTFAGLVGQGERIREEAAIVQNLLLSPLLVRFPDNTLPNPADTDAGPRRTPSPWLANACRIWPTSPGLYRAAQSGRRSWHALVDPPEAIDGFDTATNRLPPVTSRNLESTRFALLKKGPWQVFFHYGQITGSHAQSEALNWSASFGGTDISHDPGNTGYGSRIYRDYFSRGLNHNVPLVDGQGQRSWNQGRLLRFDPEAGIVSAEQPRYWPPGYKEMPQWNRDAPPESESPLSGSGVRADRSLRIEGDILLEETRIALTKPEVQARLGLSLHLQGTVLPSVTSDALAFRPVSTAEFVRGRPKAFSYWQDVCAASCRDRASVEVKFAQGVVMRIEFTVAGGGGFTLYKGLSPDLPSPARRTGFYLELDKPDAEAKFLTTITPSTRAD